MYDLIKEPNTDTQLHSINWGTVLSYFTPLYHFSLLSSITFKFASSDWFISSTSPFYTVALTFTHFLSHIGPESLIAFSCLTHIYFHWKSFFLLAIFLTLKVFKFPDLLSVFYPEFFRTLFTELFWWTLLNFKSLASSVTMR